MAKKVVATLKSQSATQKKYAKVIRAVKNPSGNYSFKEEMVPEEKVKDVLAK